MEDCMLIKLPKNLKVDKDSICIDKDNIISLKTKGASPFVIDLTDKLTNNTNSSSYRYDFDIRTSIRTLSLYTAVLTFSEYNANKSTGKFINFYASIDDQKHELHLNMSDGTVYKPKHLLDTTLDLAMDDPAVVYDCTDPIMYDWKRIYIYISRFIDQWMKGKDIKSNPENFILAYGPIDELIITINPDMQIHTKPGELDPDIVYDKSSSIKTLYAFAILLCIYRYRNGIYGFIDRNTNMMANALMTFMNICPSFAADWDLGK